MCEVVWRTTCQVLQAYLTVSGGDHQECRGREVLVLACACLCVLACGAISCDDLYTEHWDTK